MELLCHIIAVVPLAIVGQNGVDHKLVFLLFRRAMTESAEPAGNHAPARSRRHIEWNRDAFIRKSRRAYSRQKTAGHCRHRRSDRADMAHIGGIAYLHSAQKHRSFGCQRNSLPAVGRRRRVKPYIRGTVRPYHVGFHSHTLISGSVGTRKLTGRTRAKHTYSGNTGGIIRPQLESRQTSGIVIAYTLGIAVQAKNIIRPRRNIYGTARTSLELVAQRLAALLREKIERHRRGRRIRCFRPVEYNIDTCAVRMLVTQLLMLATGRRQQNCR